MALSRIPPKVLEKVWGSTGLAPWFPDPGHKVGEVWFDGSEGLPLIKFLFTSERLSIQVHPGDEYAREHENSNGKTEMWHILRSSPAARVAIGFQEPVSRENVYKSAVDGTIEGILNWISVRPGDTFFVPAGAVHAIGAGIALCEIQQRSDVTYRLYDYNRPRELHLDKALAVSYFGPVPGRSTLPVRCPFFNTERFQVTDSLDIDPLSRSSAIIVLQGEGILSGEPFLPGEVWEVEPDTPLQVRGSATLLRTYVPA